MPMVVCVQDVIVLVIAILHLSPYTMFTGRNTQSGESVTEVNRPFANKPMVNFPNKPIS